MKNMYTIEQFLLFSLHPFTFKTVQKTREISRVQFPEPNTVFCLSLCLRISVNYLKWLHFFICKNGDIKHKFPRVRIKLVTHWMLSSSSLSSLSLKFLWRWHNFITYLKLMNISKGSSVYGKKRERKEKNVRKDKLQIKYGKSFGTFYNRLVFFRNISAFI